MPTREVGIPKREEGIPSREEGIPAEWKEYPRQSRIEVHIPRKTGRYSGGTTACQRPAIGCILAKPSTTSDATCQPVRPIFTDHFRYKTGN